MNPVRKKTVSVKAVAGIVAGLVAIASLFALIVVYSGNATTVRIACVGDSITEITGYPTYLQNMLGNSYKVRNFGVVGATILLNTDRPYLKQPACMKAEAFQPQIVIIMMGTNDARTNIYQNSDGLESNFGSLVAAFQSLSSHPDVLFAKPPPIFNNTLGLSPSNLVQGVIPRVEQEATNLHVPIVDCYGPLLNHPEYFPDGVHPNSEGAKEIARIIYGAIIAEKSVAFSRDLAGISENSALRLPCGCCLKNSHFGNINLGLIWE